MIGKVLLSSILILQSSLAFAQVSCQRDLGTNPLREFDKVVAVLESRGFKDMTAAVRSGELDVQAGAKLPWNSDLLLAGRKLTVRKLSSSDPRSLFSVAKLLVEYKTVQELEAQNLGGLGLNIHSANLGYFLSTAPAAWRAEFLARVKTREALLSSLEDEIPATTPRDRKLNLTNAMRAVMVVGTLYSLIQAPAYFEEYVNHAPQILTQGEMQIVQERDRLIDGIRFQIAKPAPNERFLNSMRAELKTLHDKYPALVQSATIP